LACLIWVYRGFDWKRELPRIWATDMRWVAVAVIADILVYVTQGWRWALLLRTIEDTSVWRSVQFIYIGLFANEVLPFRSGEIIRSYLQAKWLEIEFGVVISSVVIERLIDGIWLILAFSACAHFIHLPKLLVEGSVVLAVVLIFFAALLAIAVFLKHHAHAAVRQSRWKEKLWHVVEGLNAMGSSKSFYAAVAVSVLYLALQVLPIWALMRGYGLSMTVGQAAVVLIILRLGSIPPQAPGNVGSFQALTKLGLMMFGVDKATATGFATLLFFVVTVPLWLAGFIALAATGMNLKELHHHAHSSRVSPPRT
jgi:glycosyltransferase 2 family protein